MNLNATETPEAQDREQETIRVVEQYQDSFMLEWQYVRDGLSMTIDKTSRAWVDDATLTAVFDTIPTHAVHVSGLSDAQRERLATATGFEFEVLDE